MQKVLIINHASPYGSERCLSALRLALMLTGKEGEQAQVTMFLMSDAVVAALPNQQDASGKTLEDMIKTFVSQGGTIKVCRSCAQNRGTVDLPLIEGCVIGNLTELSEAVLASDKTLTF
ncbi:MAG: DsrE/DsrF/TusD sulfur relay family protein [Brachymonas sp.]|uniref:DsrE/DsrF/TusD sulfur relay family protein n=1 Tax=unclassified Brachymonas TaxID=2621329 RepID=UPI0035AEC972